MKSIPAYNFHKTKYGEELLIDVVRLADIQKYIQKDPVHTLSYYDITFIESDNVAFGLNNSKYTLDRGDVVFSKPGDVRAWIKSENTPDGYALIFEGEFLLSFFNDPLFLQSLSYFGTQRKIHKINIAAIKERIVYLVGNITAEIQDYQSKDKHILRALLYEILMLLDREYKKQNEGESEMQVTPSRHVDSFVEAVDKDFREFHDTAYYADKLCITPNYLNAIVKKAMGVNAKLYIQNKILAEAKKKLAYSSLSVSEIAEHLNFETSSYFIRFFRKYTHSTPLQYRNSEKR